MELSDKVVSDMARLTKITEAHRVLGHKVVATIGSWDLLHIGHVRYINRAKTYGDVLIVGVDTDKGIKRYKGPLRPVIPENERMEMLSYQSSVDLVTPVDDINEKGHWQYGLVKKIKPDVFVAVKGSYSQDQLAEIKKYVGKLVVLPRQAETTSTSNVIQDTLKAHLGEMITLMGGHNADSRK